MNTISSEIMECAKIDIGETECRKEQSLRQFREWIRKHPFIKKCETDDIYLLSFLRANKFSMDRTFDSFEKCLLFVKTNKDWFDFTGERLERIFELIDAGFIRIMKKRDVDGARIFVTNHSLDPDKFTGDDVHRAHCLINTALLMEDETQLFGFKYILDLTSGMTLRHLAILSLKSVYEFSMAIRFMPLRYKLISVIGTPTFAANLVNMIKLGLSNKMLSRFHVMSDVNELWHYIDRSAMTDDYGGQYNNYECIENIRRLISDKFEKILNIHDIEIDMEKAQAMKNIHENVGSFRMLEID